MKRPVLVGIVLFMLVGGTIVLLNGPDPEVPEPKYPKVILYHGLDEVGGDLVSMSPVFLGEKSETFLIIHNAGNVELHVSEIELDISPSELASLLQK